MTTVNETDLLAHRLAVRRNWAKHIAYVPIAQWAPPGARVVATTSIVYRAGIHYRAGATSHQHLTRGARQILSVLLNSYAHATGGKPAKPTKGGKAAKPKAKAKPEPTVRGDVIVESLFGDGDNATVVLAYRYWFILFELPPVAAAPDEEEDEEDAAETDAPAAVANGRGCLLTAGLVKSCAETSALQTRIEKTISAAMNKPASRRLRHGEQVVLHPSESLTHAYGHFSTPGSIVNGPLLAYFQPGAVAVSSEAEARRVGESAIVDERYFIRSNGAVTGRGYAPPDDPDFALRHILTPAQAMVYYTEGVNSSQCDLLAYYPSIAGLSARHETGGVATPDDERPLEQLVDLMEEEERGAEAPVSLSARNLSLQQLVRSYPEVAGRNSVLLPLPTWPLPATTYVVAWGCALAEVLMLLPLPHPMGQPLPTDLVNRGLAGVRFEHPFESALALQHLRRIDERMRAAHGALTGTLTADEQMGRATAQYALAAPTDSAARDQLKVVLTAEKGIVANALDRLRHAAATYEYEEILKPQQLSMHLSNSERMSPAEFYDTPSGGGAAPLSWDTVQQNVLRQHAMPPAAEDEEKQMMALINKHVDRFHGTLLENDCLLRQRQAVQINITVLQERTRVAVAAARGRAEVEVLQANYKRDLWALRETGAEAVWQALREAPDVSNVYRGQLRDWMRAHCTADGVRASQYRKGAECPPQILDGERMFTEVIQQLHNVLRDALLSTSQSYHAAIVAFFSSFDAHTYSPSRTMPALNFLLAGATGVGKSYVLKEVQTALMPPGVMRNMALVSEKAQTTETSFDGFVLVQEEMDTKMLFAKSSSHDHGATDAVNRTKQRMTAFIVEADRAFVNDQGQAKTLTTVSSHHNVTLGGTNQYLADMDPNIGRRFMVYFMPKFLLLGDGDHAADRARVQAFANNADNAIALDRFRQTHAMYMHLAALSKTAVLPELSSDAARTQFDLVAADLGTNRFMDTRDSTKRHYILQMARNVQLWFAAYMTLYGPVAWCYHNEPPAAGAAPVHPPWSAQASLLLASQHWAVSREALVYAMTLMEFLFVPTYVEQTLSVLVLDCLELGENVNKWPFFYDISPTTKMVKCDPNYVMLRGDSQMAICRTIAAYNKEYLLRPEDVQKIFKDLEDTMASCPCIKIVGDVDPDEHMPMAIAIDAEAVPHKTAFCSFQPDPNKPNKRVLKVSLAMLAQRLRFDINRPETIRETLHITRAVHEKNEARGAALQTQYGLVARRGNAQGRMVSPLATSIQTTLANRMFEVDPALAPWLGSNSRPRLFVTGYPVEPMTVYRETELEHEVAVRDAGDDPALVPRTVTHIMMHGSHLMMPIARDPLRGPLRRTNYAKPQPTTKRARVQEESARIATFNNALGFMAKRRDIEFQFYDDLMRVLCHPGIPAVERYFYAGGPPDAARLAPGTLPLGCGPVLDRIVENIHARYHARAERLRYPLANIADRVDTVLRRIEQERADVPEGYLDVDDVAGQHTFGGITFEVGIAATPATPGRVPHTPLLGLTEDGMDIDA